MSNILSLGKRLLQLSQRQLEGFYAVIGIVQDWAKDEPSVPKAITLVASETVKKMVIEAIAEARKTNGGD